MNEYTFSILTIFMLIFSDFINDPYAKYDYGWVYVAIVFLNILINFYGIIYTGANNLIIFVKYTVRHIKYRFKLGQRFKVNTY